MKKVFTALVLCFLVSGCGAGYMVSELKGTAKPEGGIAEKIPSNKTYGCSHDKLWKAVQGTLDDQGYIFSADSKSGRIKTDPKVLGDQSKVSFFGATYYAVVIIKLEGGNVDYRVRFNKESNLVKGGELMEFPEKENELRKEFFAALDSKM